MDLRIHFPKHKRSTGPRNQPVFYAIFSAHRRRPTTLLHPLIRTFFFIESFRNILSSFPVCECCASFSSASITTSLSSGTRRNFNRGLHTRFVENFYTRDLGEKSQTSPLSMKEFLGLVVEANIVSPQNVVVALRTSTESQRPQEILELSLQLRRTLFWAKQRRSSSSKFEGRPRRRKPMQPVSPCGSTGFHNVSREGLLVIFTERQNVLEERSIQRDGTRKDQSSAVRFDIHVNLLLFRGTGYVRKCLQNFRLHGKRHWKTKSQIRVVVRLVTRAWSDLSKSVGL